MSKPCIFISPASQPWNECALGDSEQDHNRVLGAEILRLLIQDPRLITGMCPVVAGTENERLTQAVNYSDAFMSANGGNISGVPALHICLHTDAGGGLGITSFYIGSGVSRTLAQNIHNELLGCGLGYKDKGCLERGTLYELRKTMASAVLIENGFHDSITEASKFHNNINKLATCYCIAIYKTLNMDRYVAPVIVVPDTTDSTSGNNGLSEDDKYRISLVQECLNRKLLEDASWLKMYNDKIPVFAVCKMLISLENRLKTELTDLAKKIIISEMTSSKDKLISDAMNVIDKNMNDKYSESTITILTKK
jgi:hypothetical protein